MYFGSVIMLACAATFYHIGKTEYHKGILLFLISILVWNGTSFLFGWGWLMCVVGQVGLYGILTIINLSRPPRSF